MLRWSLEFGLGLVERDVGKLLRGGEVDGGLSGRVVAPGADGVEIVDKGCGKTRGESFADELGGKAVGEVLEHDEADEEGVARCPWGGGVAEEAELEREVLRAVWRWRR